jgi:hypothetical protein
MANLYEFAVAFECAQVVSIGSQADVAVRAHHEQCGALDAEDSSSDGVEPSDPVGQLGLGAESDGRFEQARAGGELLQSSVKLHERRSVRPRAAQKHEGMTGAVDKLVKVTGLPVRPSDLDCVR